MFSRKLAVRTANLAQKMQIRAQYTYPIPTVPQIDWHESARNFLMNYKPKDLPPYIPSESEINEANASLKPLTKEDGIRLEESLRASQEYTY